MISPRTKIPPPPIPWIDLPTSIYVKSLATAATTDPTAKNIKDTMTSWWSLVQVHFMNIREELTSFLPNTWLKPAITGWKTALVNKKLVPAQNASIAEPFSFAVMIGSAILKLVASRAAARVTIHIETKARRNPRVGLKGGSLAFSRGSDFAVVSGSGCCEIIEPLSIDEGYEGFQSSSSLGGAVCDMMKEIRYEHLLV
jgi:hypothetical protein